LPVRLLASDMLLVPIASQAIAGRLEPVDRPAGLGGAATTDELHRRGREEMQQAIDVPRGNPLADPIDFSPAERDLFADASAGQLRHITLLEAGLVASGASNSAAIENARARFAAVQSELRNLAVGGSDGTETAGRENKVLRRAALIHHVLHQRLLRSGYDANATNLITTLQTGVYNCASATLLFVSLAEQYDVPVQAIELPGHVRAIIDCGDQRYEIEVTCPVWSQAYRAVRTASNLTNQATGTADSFDAGWPVSPLGLVASIYYNRGIDAFNDRRFAEALLINRRALLLDPDNAMVRANLLATVNNWGLALCDGGHYAEAEKLLIEGQQFAPQHEAFQHNAIHVEQIWNRMQAAAAAAQKIGSAMPSL
jgi:tetratricopeptide (TPR) repeat protein